MKVNTYAGWEVNGELTVVFFAEKQTIDLLAVYAPGLSETLKPIGWGKRGPEAEMLAQVILWHATWDHGVVEDLYQVFHDQMTSRFASKWEIERETVRTWIQHHQAQRELMHGRDPMRNCPGCGG